MKKRKGVESFIIWFIVLLAIILLILLSSYGLIKSILLAKP